VEDPNFKEPTDEELFKALDAVPMPPGHKEMGRIILPISVDEYYNMFHGVNAPYSFEKYFIYRGYGKI
jgi:hypothetical protein